MGGFLAGADATLGPMQLVFDVYPSATGGNRYASIAAGDSTAWRNLCLVPTAGFVGIGTTAPNSELHVKSSSARVVNVEKTGTYAAGLNYIAFTFSDGEKGYVGYGAGSSTTMYLYSPNAIWIYSGGNAIYREAGNTHFNDSSDVRIKEDIRAYKYGLADLIKLNPVEYWLKSDKKRDGNKPIGLVAQEVQEIIPEAVYLDRKKLSEEDTEETDVLGLGVGDHIHYMLINSVKELNNRLEKLEKK